MSRDSEKGRMRLLRFARNDKFSFREVFARSVSDEAISCVVHRELLVLWH